MQLKKRSVISEDDVVDQRGELICVGVITSTFGIKGYLKVKCFTERAKDIADFMKVVDSENRPYKLSLVSANRNFAVISLDGVNSRKEAEEYHNKKLYVRREELPNSDQDEYYYADLVGMSAFLKCGACIGTVQGVSNFGSVDLIEIRNTATEDTMYYPFTKRFVVDVDIEGRVMICEPIEELIASKECQELGEL
ncbi:16S rRNA processing protein RimM [Rickettsiales endosymbiont of Peranema trichophorum]|uniref:ribosome maturation factor RimM n=1 Tax=Rickettsiales endosymbiont of Peranema trichophorum TaxID=2486577 RepID=UPI00102327E4|nr:ribosome maturation factor RimM [Rickettsiales endosymbiont of Peranema trichophorum]RZI47553.1 16S rRNA processing protein RimM [Rickettsiales endosymbiont of Peranema trichophorum]